VTEREYTVLCPFGGMGGGALGFLQAHVAVAGVSATFRCLGNIDFDKHACADFEYLTGSPAWCVDVDAVTVAELHARYGRGAPDAVFMSPPCKGASGLLSEEVAATAKYQRMNGLAERWIELMLAAWPEGPRLVLFENVPRIKTRAPHMIARVYALLRAAGYVCTDGFHDCGEIGGLAQRRRRFLLVARDERRVPQVLYQPPKQRVRGCGEVLGDLPMPGAPEAGPLHRMPAISWLNWVRLALIPAGGDWRDLPGVLVAGEKRREKFRREHVEAWTDPSVTIAGPGSNGPYGVADPRGRVWFKGVLGVRPWTQAMGTVTGETSPTNGAFSVADPRLALPSCSPDRHHNKYVVLPWEEPARTVIGATRPGSGAPSVADPRVTQAFDAGYAVLDWKDPARTIAGKTSPGCGAYAVADPRDIPLGCTPRAGAYGVLSWEAAAGTITGAARVDNGAFAVADPRFPDEPPAYVVRDIRKPPVGATPIIIAADGTWHRPLTTLELATLQGLPARVRGEPLRLSGASVSGWRERIGNVVPPGAGRAIAEQMLATLLTADAGGFALGSTEVWVEGYEDLGRVQIGGVA
jgi:site-specific DNA-cytosine methylase